MVRKKTGITSRLRISKVEDRDLTVESHDSGRNERFFETSANVIEDVARLGIVGTVQSDIAFGNKLLQFIRESVCDLPERFQPRGLLAPERLLRFRLYHHLSAPLVNDLARRLVKSTVSESTIVIFFTPEEARYREAGDPSPPAPMISTRPCEILFGLRLRPLSRVRDESIGFLARCSSFQNKNSFSRF